MPHTASFGGAGDLRTHRFKRFGGMYDVFAFQKAGDFGDARRQRAKHQRAVRNGFITRDTQRAGKGGGQGM